MCYRRSGSPAPPHGIKVRVIVFIINTSTLFSDDYTIPTRANKLEDLFRDSRLANTPPLLYGTRPAPFLFTKSLQDLNVRQRTKKGPCRLQRSYLSINPAAPLDPPPNESYTSRKDLQHHARHLLPNAERLQHNPHSHSPNGSKLPILQPTSAHQQT